MDFDQIIDSITPEIYDNLKRAIETGRWPSGQPLTPEQREQSLQAVIAYGERHLAPEDRVGFIDRGAKGEQGAADAPQKLRWTDDGKGTA